MEPRIQEEDVLIAGGDTNERKRKEFGFIWLGEGDLGGGGREWLRNQGCFLKLLSMTLLHWPPTHSTWACRQHKQIIPGPWFCLLNCITRRKEEGGGGRA